MLSSQRDYSSHPEGSRSFLLCFNSCFAIYFIAEVQKFSPQRDSAHSLLLGRLGLSILREESRAECRNKDGGESRTGAIRGT